MTLRPFEDIYLYETQKLIEFRNLIETALNNGIQEKELTEALELEFEDEISLWRYAGTWPGHIVHEFFENTIQRLHQEAFAALRDKEKLEARLKIVTEAGYRATMAYRNLDIESK